MRNPILIFSHSVEGHHLEFINHLYQKASLTKDREYIFLLPPEFKILKNDLDWDSNLNIKIEFISEKDLNRSKKNKLFQSIIFCKLIKSKTIEYNIENVFLITLMPIVPLAIFFFYKRKIKISGIIYLIYLYRWKESNLSTKILDTLKHLILTKFGVFQNIYLLNDRISPQYLNKKFKTDIYKYLPDPHLILSRPRIENLRTEFDISEDKQVFLHFGALSERKGTIEIINAILSSDQTTLNSFCFIFAGKISNDIKDNFYTLVEKARTLTQIIVIDKFCDYNLIRSLCFSSNFILIPYKNPYQSSGVLGFGSEFRIPVISSKSGLLGKLIRRYKLGVLMEHNCETELKKVFKEVSKNNLKIRDSFLFNQKIIESYIVERSVTDFCDTIISDID